MRVSNDKNRKGLYFIEINDVIFFGFYFNLLSKFTLFKNSKLF
jgi:hypothetical protein